MGCLPRSIVVSGHRPGALGGVPGRGDARGSGRPGRGQRPRRQLPDVVNCAQSALGTSGSAYTSTSAGLDGFSDVLTLHDLTTGGGFTTTQPCPQGAKCRDASAEVITEDPGASIPVFDLADFGLVNHTAVLLHTSTGVRGSLVAPQLWNTEEIEMLDGSGNLMAVPSTLYAGQAFNIGWARGS